MAWRSPPDASSAPAAAIATRTADEAALRLTGGPCGLIMVIGPPGAARDAAVEWAAACLQRNRESVRITLDDDVLQQGQWLEALEDRLAATRASPSPTGEATGSDDAAPRLVFLHYAATRATFRLRPAHHWLQTITRHGPSLDAFLVLGASHASTVPWTCRHNPCAILRESSSARRTAPGHARDTFFLPPMAGDAGWQLQWDIP